MLSKKINQNSLKLITIALLLFSLFTQAANESQWPAKKTAVSLSYDDALHSQLDNALPTLNKYNFRASFYVVPTSEAFQQRLEEWRMLAKDGHELGNHTLLHSCRGSLPGREWVASDRDLDKQQATTVANEVKLASTLLQALDGNTQRTFTIPCGDRLANGEDYVNLIKNDFLAIKGQGVSTGFASLYVVSDLSGEELIKLVQKQTGKTPLINILFHGIGADHLSVSTEAHNELLKFLAENQETYWVDTYLNIMKAQTNNSSK